MEQTPVALRLKKMLSSFQVLEILAGDCDHLRRRGWPDFLDDEDIFEHVTDIHCELLPHPDGDGFIISDNRWSHFKFQMSEVSSQGNQVYFEHTLVLRPHSDI